MYETDVEPAAPALRFSFLATTEANVACEHERQARHVLVRQQSAAFSGESLSTFRAALRIVSRGADQATWP